MKEYYNVLEKIGLFEGIGREDLLSMLSCLGAATVEVEKGGFVLQAGDRVRHVGAVLTGRLHIIREDIDGGRVLIAAVEPGELFAEALCCANVPESPVSVTADLDSVVLLLGFQRILHTCSNSCEFHARLIENMLGVLAIKNLQMQNRMEFLSKKSIRARIMSYFESVALRQGREFTIPLNRGELADFLCADRSALSRELGRLKSEGILDFHRNSFRIL